MRVLLVDDHALFMEGLQNLLTARGIEVVGTAANGQQALVKSRDLRPDVILMDIQMPGLGGLESTRAIKAEMPDIKIVMLTVSGADEDLFQAIRSGASGYVLKSVEGAELFGLLEGLSAGRSALSPGMEAKVLEEFARQASRLPGADAMDRLTPRQREVLTLVGQGLPYKDVAAALYISERTVKFHMEQILDHLHLRTRLQAVAFARRAGLVGGQVAPPALHPRTEPTPPRAPSS